MWVRLRFDIAWSDLAFGIRSAGWPLDRDALEKRICRFWSAPEEMFPCLSVRSGFDLFLSSLRLPPKSEVLMSALTIPDMVRIVEHHNLVAVPIDLDISRMAPRLDVLRRAVRPSTRAILVAHLFGSRVPMDPIIALARRHDLVVIEDCAQAFTGRDYQGHPDSDAAMFSFGPIKTATALGGAVLRIGDPGILGRMRTQHAHYPIQDRGFYLRRLLKYTVLKAASCRPLCDGILSLCRAAELDHDHLINSSVRGFPGPYFFQRIRHQPALPLLAMIERRLRTFDPRRIADRAARGDLTVSLLPADAQRPAGSVADHTYWVFPILAKDPEKVIGVLRKAGFDATRGGSLRVIDPPPGRPELDARAIRLAVDQMVFLPLCRQMPGRSVHLLARLLAQMSDELIHEPIVMEPVATPIRCPAGPTPVAVEQGSV